MIHRGLGRRAMQVTVPNLKPEGAGMPSLPILDLPLIEGTAESLAGYGEIVRDPERQKIEIVRWPAQGWRPVDSNSGDEGGTTEGIFACQWVGDVLKAQNHAVGGDYVLGWSCLPREAREASSTLGRHRALIGAPTIIPTAARCSSRWSRPRSWSRWRCRVTTSPRRTSRPSGSTVRKASI